MQTFYGKSVLSGIAIGKLYVHSKAELQVKRLHVENSQQEIDRYQNASKLAYEQLGQLYQESLIRIGEANAAIFQIHQMMLEDGDFVEAIENMIRTQAVNAEFAVASIADNFHKMFSQMEDDYMRARAADVKDISERILSNLKGKQDDEKKMGEPSIILALDLAPSETVTFDPKQVLGFVTKQGSVNSHTAILARTMNIPAIVGTAIDIDESFHGKMAILDGKTGNLYIEPDDETLLSYQNKLALENQQKQLLLDLKGKENITKDGKKIQVFANIGNTKDLAYVLQNDAGGIGLFRSEFLYLEKDDYPTEEEQFAIYKSVAETMAGKKVIIRTLDIGADKQAPYFGLEQEENPAMGLRAIRICLTRPEIFSTQLRAILRASAYGTIAIMYPMIISTKEWVQIQEIVVNVKQELRNQGIPFEDVEQGVMIETPAAVMISDELASEVNFFSIGTNDLTQYTLAIDRQNPSLDQFYDSHHPAILKMIGMVVENAHKHGIWAGICGELGADLELTEKFLKMGVDELSVSPGKVLPLRDTIRKLDLSK